MVVEPCMSRTFPLMLVVALLGSAACSSSDTPAPSATSQSPVEAIERAAAKASPASSAAAANACLLGYQTRYDALLPLEKAAQVASRPAEAAEVEYSKVLKNPQYHSVRYTWKGARTRKVEVLGREIEVPQHDTVELTGLTSSTLESFKGTYRAATDADESALNAEIDRSKEKALATEGGKAVAKNVGGMLMQVARAYRDVDGIGDAASFNSVESTLYVLDRGVKFAVTVNLDDDAAANRDKAIGLARQIVETCR
jgi:hypothetical protein